MRSTRRPKFPRKTRKNDTLSKKTCETACEKARSVYLFRRQRFDTEHTPHGKSFLFVLFFFFFCFLLLSIPLHSPSVALGNGEGLHASRTSGKSTHETPTEKSVRPDCFRKISAAEFTSKFRRHWKSGRHGNDSKTIDARNSFVISSKPRRCRIRRNVRGPDTWKNDSIKIVFGVCSVVLSRAASREIL